jgi:glycosyltransferase involved in cell wall biosynthesis
VLFLGHLRPEKGVDVLAEAWFKYLSQAVTPIRLVIAGNLPSGVAYEFEKLRSAGADVRVGFVDDQQYVSLLENASAIVLPYIRGTNSAVLSTALSLGVPVLASDIPMFRGHSLLDESNLFPSENTSVLASRFAEIEKGILPPVPHETELLDYKTEFKGSVQKYFSQFDRNLNG